MVRSGVGGGRGVGWPETGNTEDLLRGVWRMRRWRERCRSGVIKKSVSMRKDLQCE